MKKLVVKTAKFKNSKFPEFMNQVLEINTKEDADKFFKDNQHSRFQFVNSYVNKRGNYCLEYIRDLNAELESEKMVCVINFALCLQDGSAGQSTILEFTSKTNSHETVL